MTDGAGCRVAALQLTSGADVAANLASMRALLEAAAGQGARLAVLPENCAFFAADEAARAAVAEVPGDGPIQAFLAGCARELDLEIVAGSLPLAIAGERRCHTASVLFDAAGAVRAVYRKLHLFDVDIPERDERYRESDYHAPGDDVVLADSRAGKLGLTICYDLRFPELYRALSAGGASVFSVPSAFTEATGRAHWDILLRARAIENLAWVVAAAQHGEHPGGRRTWGHTRIVDPWGRVVAERATGPGVVVADLDPALAARLRREFPVLDHRRL